MQEFPGSGSRCALSIVSKVWQPGRGGGTDGPDEPTVFQAHTARHIPDVIFTPLQPRKEVFFYLLHR